VGRGELPETLRIYRPGRMVAFGKRDAVTPGYTAAAAAARAAGFEPLLRLAGGRAAVFHEDTLVLAHAIPDPEPRVGIRERFAAMAEAVAAALRRLGVDARVGEVPGEYCPGEWSVNARGRVKLAGTAQRLIAGASHTGAVIVVANAERVREILVPIYEALGLDWDPATAGSVADEVPAATWDAVAGALLEEYEHDHELEPAALDRETLALARRFAEA
jgi:lipoate-protein ligase A